MRHATTVKIQAAYTEHVRTAAVDFDGTLDHGTWPDGFRSDQRAVSVLRRFRARGGRVILWTVRCGEPLAQAVGALMRAGLAVDAVNENLPDSAPWMRENIATGPSPKIYADVYIDDRGTLDGRVDWDAWAQRLGVR